MALRDWILINDMPTGKFYSYKSKKPIKKVHYSVTITYYRDLSLYEDVKDHWEVSIATHEKVIEKYFSSRIKAKSYAMNYMRRKK